MTRDNVTPFRRRKPQRPQRSPSPGGGLATHRGRAVLVHALTLASFAVSFFAPGIVLGFTGSVDAARFAGFFGLALGFAALFVAAGNRQSAMPWAQTHHEHVVRTLVIGYAVWTLASLLTYFGPLGVAAFFIQVGVLIWVVVRAGVGLVLAILRKPIPRPKGILF
ncbi:MAG: hypothetical protein ABUL55_01560 [Pseudomonadota bacterium]